MGWVGGGRTLPKASSPRSSLQSVSERASRFEGMAATEVAAVRRKVREVMKLTILAVVVEAMRL